MLQRSAWRRTLLNGTAAWSLSRSFFGLHFLKLGVAMNGATSTLRPASSKTKSPCSSPIPQRTSTPTPPVAIWTPFRGQTLSNYCVKLVKKGGFGSASRPVGHYLHVCMQVYTLHRQCTYACLTSRMYACKAPQTLQEGTHTPSSMMGRQGIEAKMSTMAQ